MTKPIDSDFAESLFKEVSECLNHIPGLASDDPMDRKTALLRKAHRLSGRLSNVTGDASLLAKTEATMLNSGIPLEPKDDEVSYDNSISKAVGPAFVHLLQLILARTKDNPAQTQSANQTNKNAGERMINMIRALPRGKVSDILMLIDKDLNNLKSLRDRTQGDAKDIAETALREFDAARLIAYADEPMTREQAHAAIGQQRGGR